jgi:hypothetical protein
MIATIPTFQVLGPQQTPPFDIHYHRGRYFIGLLLYADDNHILLAIHQSVQLQPILSDEFTEAFGLNINLNKTKSLCINTSAALPSTINSSKWECPH